MWCAIRTYAAHADELGNKRQTSPVFFVKPEACLTEGAIDVTRHPGEIHHEVELVLRLDEGLHVDGIAVGLDLTDRAAQQAARPDGLPWARGKAFIGAARLGPFVPWNSGMEGLSRLHLELRIDGELRQQAALSSMSITPQALLAELQSWAPLMGGDLVFTGTPSGVGQLLPGQHVSAVLCDGEGTVLSSLELDCC